MSAELRAGPAARLRAWGIVVGVAWRASPWRSLVALVCTVVSNLTGPAFALALGVLADGLARADRGRAMAGVGAVVGVTAAGSVLGVFTFPVRMRIREMASHQLDLEIVAMAAGMPGIEHFERPSHADHLETLRVQRGLLAGAFDAASAMVGAVVAVVGGVGVLVSLDGVLVLLPILGLPNIWIASRATRRSLLADEAVAPNTRLRNRLVAMGLSPVAAKEIRVFGLLPELRRRISVEQAAVRAEKDRVALRSVVEQTAGQLLFVATFAGAVGLLIVRAADGDGSVLRITTGLALAGSIQGSLASLVAMAGWLRSTAEAARRYGWLRDRAAEDALVHTPAAPEPVPARLAEGIRFERVGFRYPGTDADVLAGVDLLLPAGSIVAVVGDNGAGKSTLVKLLAKHYRPTAGRITLDGTDLASLRTSAWRQAISAGFQDFARFELVAAEAIGLGVVDALDDRGEAVAALERAGAGGLAGELPLGIETQLGRQFADGAELSGGQWQKVALGRAMRRPAPLVLLLDEPTAALDAETEHALFDRYATAARQAAAATGAITVLVSHRFSTVRAADLIVVVDGRGVAETGTHDELMAAGGAYAELYRLQAASYR